jgi:phosphatidylserine/phosphatidylglycerophosphate/cardiolipin synthase-like enzyme
MTRRLRPAALLLVALLASLGPLATAAAQEGLGPEASFELGFSPGGGSTALVIKVIDSARSTLLIVAYEFTDRDVAEAVERAAHRGVKVRVVADYRAAQGKYSQVRILGLAGVPVRLDDHYAITHDKFIVVDGETVETGSYNYSQSAAKRNAENVLVLWKAPAVAAGYTAEFERLWEESEAVK